jgi:acyl-CoA thioesterase II
VGLPTCDAAHRSLAPTVPAVTDYRTPVEELAPPGVALRDVLTLERLDRDLFRACAVFEETWPLYGGQVAAQALLAAGATVPGDRAPHSLHGYFLRPGDSRAPVVFSVERDRDGGSFSARRVVALQDGEVILNLAASFHRADDTAAEVEVLRMPVVEQPAATQQPPRLLDFDLSVPGQPGGLVSFPTRVWLRCTAGLPATPLLDAALLTYLSDLFTGAGGLPASQGTWQTTLDHALWFHRPSRGGEWVLMDLVPRAVSRGRAMYDGTLWHPDGTLVASLAQETLFRPRRR